MKKLLILGAALAAATLTAGAASAQVYGYGGYGNGYGSTDYGYGSSAYGYAAPVRAPYDRYRDSDRDGIPDRAEWGRDRDRDGRPDQWDRYDNRRDRHHGRHDRRRDDRYDRRSDRSYGW